jgi:hypothetical protein
VFDAAQTACARARSMACWQGFGKSPMKTFFVRAVLTPAMLLPPLAQSQVSLHITRVPGAEPGLRNQPSGPALKAPQQAQRPRHEDTPDRGEPRQEGPRR